MSILITGGAGYIGSHVVKFLLERQEQVVVVDNLQCGHTNAIDVEHFYRMDIRDREKLDEVFKRHFIDGVIHLAGSSVVAESMANPFEYYHNNVFGTLSLLEAMKSNYVRKLVFSSSAAVYGQPQKTPILETDETRPVNVYGETKLAMEKMMRWYDQVYGLKYASLRYFNAAGAHSTGTIGEDHRPETHLIPLVLQVALGLREEISVFGNQHDTKDGTCIRDYIHVMDLAEAHLKAFNYLREGHESDIFNLGNGQGSSVLEVVEAAEKVTGQIIPMEILAERPGDPGILIASPAKACSVLGWKPKYQDLKSIIEDAWRWHVGHPEGYGSPI